MKIITCPNEPFLNAKNLYAVELWITDYGFDYQLREAFPIEAVTDQLVEGAVPDTSNPRHLDNCLYKTEKSAVFGPITERIAVKFDDFRARPDFSDRAEYALAIDFLEEFNTKYNRASAISKEHQTFNVILATAPSKENPIDWFGRTVGNRFISIQVPLAGSPNDDWFIHTNLPDKDLLRVTPEQEILDVIEKDPTNPQRFLPIVKFNNTSASVAEDGTVDLAFQLINPITNSNITTTETKVYLKTTGGRLSKQVVQTVSGAGTVKFIPEYLSAGDTIKVSCGFKYFSGTDDCLITVV
jgi:hypothetical protein